MANSANTFQSLKPIYKQSYAGPSSKKKKKSSFEKLKKRILKDWKPKNP
jgi:hypothetical protein